MGNPLGVKLTNIFVLATNTNCKPIGCITIKKKKKIITTLAISRYLLTFFLLILMLFGCCKVNGANCTI